MPISGEEDRQPAPLEERDGPVHPRDDRVTVGNAESAAWTEVILDIHDQQRGAQGHNPGPANSDNSLKACAPRDSLEVPEIVGTKREIRR